MKRNNLTVSTERTFIHDEFASVSKESISGCNSVSRNKPKLAKGITVKQLYEFYTKTDMLEYIRKRTKRQQNFIDYYENSTLENIIANMYCNLNSIEPSEKVAGPPKKKPKVILYEPDSEEDCEDSDSNSTPMTPLSIVSSPDLAEEVVIKKPEQRKTRNHATPTVTQPKTPAKQHQPSKPVPELTAKKPTPITKKSVAPKQIPIPLPKVNANPQKWSPIQVCSWLDDNMKTASELNMSDFRQLKRYIVSDSINGYHMTNFADQCKNDFDAFVNTLKLLRIPDGTKLLLVEAIKVWKT
jgi:hypothetical protein